MQDRDLAEQVQIVVKAVQTFAQGQAKLKSGYTLQGNLKKYERPISYVM